jgi:hypothetical protein
MLEISFKSSSLTYSLPVIIPVYRIQRGGTGTVLMSQQQQQEVYDIYDLFINREYTEKIFKFDLSSLRIEEPQRLLCSSMSTV